MKGGGGPSNLDLTPEGGNFASGNRPRRRRPCDALTKSMRSDEPAAGPRGGEEAAGGRGVAQDQGRESARPRSRLQPLRQVRIELVRLKLHIRVCAVAGLSLKAGREILGCPGLNPRHSCNFCTATIRYNHQCRFRTWQDSSSCARRSCSCLLGRCLDEWLPSAVASPEFACRRCRRQRRSAAAAAAAADAHAAALLRFEHCRD